MPQTLAQMIRAKFPGAYDDLSDQDLESQVVAKFPGAYDDIPRTAADAPGFHSENAMDAQGRPLVADGPMDAAREFVRTVNPIPAVQQIGKALIPERVARAAGASDAETFGPVNAARGILAAQNRVKSEADAAWAQGDHLTAVRKYFDWLLPVVGPMLDEQADNAQAGKLWTALGGSAGLSAALFGPKAVETARVKVPAVARETVNPIEREAVRFGEARGIPIDAATATQNPVIANIQKATAQTPLGARPAKLMQASQDEALTRVGRQLADEVYPDAVAPEQAGEGVRQSLNFQVRKYHGQATEAYDRLRRYESDPELAEQVPSTEAAAFQRTLNQEAVRTAGRAPTDAEWSELRRMREELDAIGYSEGGTIRNAARHYEVGDDMRQSPYVKPAAGAPVYHDILQEAPGTADMTRKAVQVSIEQALKTGKFTNAAKGALVVAQKRLAGSARVSRPMLPPGAGAAEAATETMLLPADVRAAKAALRPVYDRLMRQLPITQQRSSPGLKAIENIVNGPDYVPITTLDTDLGAIKGIARGADLPELRDVSQGLAAKAVSELDKAVRGAAAKAGPDAVKALEEGRAATRSKYAVADVLATLRDEPVQAFNQATYAKDAGIGRLRELAKYAPAEMPRLGRAYLDDLFAKATSEGGFGRAKSVQQSWLNLGPETKRLLFKEPGQVKALDNYFRLARMIAENPNPSGTALTGTTLASVQGLFYAPMTTIGANVGAGVISQVLNTPKAVQAFTRGSTLLLGPGKTSVAARSAGLADLMRAAREAGVQGQPATGREREQVNPAELPVQP